VDVPVGDLPDLALGATDILVVPASGSVGQDFVVAVTLHNIGAAAVQQPELAVDLTIPDGTRIPLSAPTLAQLPAGQSSMVSFPLGVLDMAGAYRIEARADPRQQVFESNENNNGAFAAFAVSADGVPVLDVSLTRAVFAPGDLVTGDVGVTNPGAPFNGYVDLRVVDANGVLVADLGQHSIAALGFGQHWTTPISWSAEGILAGDYGLQARLESIGGDVLAETSVDFTLGAVRHVQLALGTDTPTQIVGNDVVMHSSLVFSDGNALIEDATLRLTATDANGIERWRREQALGTLLPGHALARDDAWSTGALAEGVYSLTLSLLSAEYTVSVDTSVTLQTAASGVALAGSIGFEPGTVLIAGQELTLAWQVANGGAATLTGVQTRLRLMDASSPTPVGEYIETFDIDGGSSHASSRVLTAPPLALVGHAAILEARLPGDAADEWRLLAQQGFAVADRMPPVIIVSSPVADTTQPAVVPFRATIVDRHSAIVAAEVSIDGGSWQPVSAGADGQYARGLGGLIDGEHAMRVRARDSWGNEAQSGPHSFMVDATPPLIVIAGVLDGELVNHVVTPQITISDAHLATFDIRLNGAIFDSGTPIDEDGSYVLTVRATDEAGNQGLRSVRFAIDRTAPGIEIVAPVDGSVIGANAVRVEVQTEASASVVLVTGVYQTAAIADGQGRVGFDAVPLVLGANRIEAVATDAAGNAGTPASIDVTYEIAAIAPLTGTLQPGSAELAHGLPLLVHVTAQNPNAAALPAQSLRVRVSGPDMTELATQTLSHDFGPHEVLDVDLEFASTDWPLGTLALTLDLDQIGEWVTLDARELELVDRTPPLLTLDAPVTDSVLRSPLVVQAMANDALSGIAVVEASIDDGDWQALAAAGGSAWTSAPLDLADGNHQVELQARDAAGNLGHAGPTPFAIDNTPPLINIAGVADGDLLAHAVAPKIAIFDAHLTTSDVRLNGEPFASGSLIEASGDYRIDATATDAADNESAVTVRFTLDLDAPVVTFVSPEPGAVVAAESVDVVGQTEARAHVHLENGSFSVDLDSDVNGRFDVLAVPLQPGINTITAQASDRAGNLGPEAVLVVLREAAVAADVAGQIGALFSPLPQGAPLDVPYALQNTGAIGLPALPVRLELRPASGGDTTVSDAFTVDLPVGADHQGMRQLVTTAAAPGEYLLILQTRLPVVGGIEWMLLDTASIRLLANACQHGDTIFADGFDGVGTRRDDVILCDGFEVRVASARSDIATAPWIKTTAWLAHALLVRVGAIALPGLSMAAESGRRRPQATHRRAPAALPNRLPPIARTLAMLPMRDGDSEHGPQTDPIRAGAGHNGRRGGLQ
jgi:hypothetical protein